MVAAENGISQSLADAIVSAYIEDLKNSLKCGESISVPGLFSIATTALRDGHLEVRGTVSSALRQELRQVKSV
jgi:nucleoid DNA-binding protein